MVKDKGKLEKVNVSVYSKNGNKIMDFTVDKDPKDSWMDYFEEANNLPDDMLEKLKTRIRT